MTDMQRPTEAANDDRLEGIGGWLILPIIGLGLTIIFTGINLTTALSRDNLQAYRAFFNGTLPPQIDKYIYLGLGSLFLGVLLVALAIVCLGRIFQRWRHLPKLMVAYYVFLLVVAAYEFIGMLGLPELNQSNSDFYEGIRSTLQAVVAAAIWVPYFLVSKRVKNTFVE